MAKLFINDTTLSAIADAIRVKTGKSNTITPSNMPIEISSITTTGSAETLLKPSEYPDYVRTEVARVADEVRKVLTNESIVSICMSDSHYPADTQTKNGVLHAMMAIKGLTYLLPVDFIAHLGDVGYEGPSATEQDTDRLQANLLEMLGYVKESNGDSIPLFVAIGNHDNGNYITSTDNSDMLLGTFLYNNFTALSASSNTVFSGEVNGGYCYRDFNDKKVRVFLLNTSEGLITGGYSTDNGASETQRAWVASKLQELNTKSDAADWKFIVLCHYPMDYGSAKTLSNVFEAYVKGASITLSGTSYNFSGKNAAKFLVQFHGHIHNFLVDKLYGGAVSSRVNGTPSAQYNAYRMAIPNAQSNRENYYYNQDAASTDGTLWGIKFFEGSFDTLGKDAQYNKTSGTVKDTSFVVNVINPSEDKIYSFCYGAGYDRVLGLGSVKYYSIITNLSSGVLINSDTTISIESGQPYSATIEIPNNYNIDKLTITMGGVDITAAVYSDGKIDIPEVSGNLVITVQASKIPTSNLNTIAYSFDANSAEIYNNGRGYKNDYRLSGNGAAEWETATAGYVLTGIIAWDRISAINISGAEIVELDGYCRIYFTNVARDYVYSPWLNNSKVSDKQTIYDYFDVEEISTKKYKLTPKSSWNVNSSITHFAMSLKGSGEDLIVTFGDDTGETSDNCIIKQNLVNATSSNNAVIVEKGSEFYTEISPKPDYELTSVTVIMGGVDITSSVYADGVVSIPVVTGNVVVTVTTRSLLGYTNQIPLSTVSYNSDEIYNSPYGYKTGTRITTSGHVEEANEYLCCTGHIALSGKAGDVVRIKNVTVLPTGGSSVAHFTGYNANGTSMWTVANDVLVNGGVSPNTNLVTVTVENGIITINIGKAGAVTCRLTCGVIDDSSIITVNEEII